MTVKKQSTNSGQKKSHSNASHLSIFTPKKSAEKSGNKQTIKFYDVNKTGPSVKEANEALVQHMSGSKVLKKSHAGSPSGFLMFKKLRSPSTIPEINYYERPEKLTPSKPTNIFQQIQLQQQKTFNTNESSQQRLSVQAIILEKFKTLFQSYQTQINREIVVGFNSIIKELERNNLSVIVIEKDWKKELIQLVMEICMNKRVPFLILPNFFPSLKELIGVKNVNCFGLRIVYEKPSVVPGNVVEKKKRKKVAETNQTNDKNVNLQGGESEESRVEDQGEDIHLDARNAVLDDLRGYLLKQARKAMELL
jgi:ribosomal protein L7Ae-like RNA K-turn-binding protein